MPRDASGAGDSRHKQVFRRTYSSNSIKTRQVSTSSSARRDSGRYGVKGNE